MTNPESFFETTKQRNAQNNKLRQSKLTYSIFRLLISSFVSAAFVFAILSVLADNILFWGMFIYVLTVIGPIGIAPAAFQMNALVPLIVGAVICFVVWIFIIFNKSIPANAVAIPIAGWSVVGGVTVYWCLCGSV